MSTPATATLERPSKTVFSAPLRAADRSDCCNVQALVRATKADMTLLFCGHHFNKHQAALIADGWDIDDQRERINDNPLVSSSKD